MNVRASVTNLNYPCVTKYEEELHTLFNFAVVHKSIVTPLQDGMNFVSGTESEYFEADGDFLDVSLMCEGTNMRRHMNIIINFGWACLFTDITPVILFDWF